MTIAQELTQLDKTIKAFGPDSYLGPWLAENRSAIEAALLSDHSPDVRVLLPGAAYEQARGILAEANRVAAEVRAAADRYATEQREKTVAAVERYRTDAREALRAAANRL